MINYRGYQIDDWTAHVNILFHGEVIETTTLGVTGAKGIIDYYVEGK